MIHDILLLIPCYLALGSFVGVCAGLLGIGGGLILTPCFYYIFHYYGGILGHSTTEDVAMHMALATSMAIILPTGLSSAGAQIKRKAVDWPSFRLLSPGVMVGACIGVYLVSRLHSDSLKLIFACGLAGIAISMIMRKETAAPVAILNKIFCAFPASIVIGTVSVLLGISGSVLNSPYMNRAGLPLKNAIATGAALGVIFSLTANIAYVVAGGGSFVHVDWASVALIAPMSVAFAPVGVRLSHALPVPQLKLIFAILLILLSLKMVMDVL